MLFPRLMLAIVLLAFILPVNGSDRPHLPAPPPADAAFAAPLAPPYAPAELIIAFHNQPAASQHDGPPNLPNGLEFIEYYPLTGLVRVRVVDGDLAGTARWLVDSGLARFAEPNYRLRLTGLVPDDPNYAEQAGYWELLGAPDAWEIVTGSRSVVVALLDGAVDLDHPDLVNNIWLNVDEIPDNGIDDDGNGYVDDMHGYDFVGSFPGGPGVPNEDNDPDTAPGDSALGDGLDQDGDGSPDGAVGHGTRVAGIIAAQGNNGVGGAGAAWSVALMPLRVTDPEGNGFFSSFVRALEYAVANGADVVNVSLAATLLPLSASEAVAVAVEAGLVIVAAAGNTGNTTTFPAALPGIIAVGSHGGLESPDVRPLFSPRTGADLVAPGVDVFSTNVEAISGEPGYATTTGTSFAAPFVTGTVALILSLDPTATPDDVLALLRAGATDLPDAGFPQWDGAGRLHMGNTIAAVLGRPPSPPVIESAAALDDSIRLVARAAPGSVVSFLDVPTGTLLGVVPATIDGVVTLEFAQTDLPETAAVLSIVATAEGPTGVSAASLPVPLALPRSVPLQPGWNLVSWAGVAGFGVDVFAELPPAVTRIFRWNIDRWQLHVPAHPVLTIAEVRTGDALWIFVDGDGDAAAAWPQLRNGVEPAQLVPGWQMVAWPGISADVADVAAATGADVSAIFAWDAQAQAFVAYHAAVVEPGVGLERVQHLDAVWLLVEGAGGAWPDPALDAQPALGR